MRALFIFAVSFLLTTCSGYEERYEELNKLRAIGVETTPVASQLSTLEAPQIATLKFYVVKPDKVELTAENLKEESDFLFLNINGTIPEPEELNGIFLYTISATASLPPAAALPIPDDIGFVRLSYGLKIKAGAEEQNVIGRLLAYKPDDEKIRWTQPEITLQQPTGEISKGEVDLKAEIESSYEENWRVSWFVTGGKVRNRRAINTVWETPEEGEHTVILTVRGLKSNTFVLKTTTVTVKP